MRTPSLRTVLLLALALLIAAPAPSVAQEPEWLLATAAEQLVNEPITSVPKRRPPIEVRSQSGFDHRGRGCLPGSWTPVTIWSRNNTDQEMFATVKLATLTAEGAVNGSRVQIPVRLPPHRIVTTRSVVWVAPQDTRLEVQVSSSTGESGQDTQALLAPPTFKRAFVVIGATHAGPEGRVRSYPHDDLARGGVDAHSLEPTYPLVGQLSPERAETTSNARWMVFHPVLETLPDRWIAYTGLRGVVISDTSLVPRMTQPQWDALMTYVRSGGHLVVEADRPAALAVERIRQLVQVEALGQVMVDPVTIVHGVTSEKSVPTVPLRSLRSPDGGVRFGGEVLMVSHHEGLGVVTTLGFSLAHPKLTRQESFYPEMLRRVLNTECEQPLDALRQTGAGNLAKQLDFDMKSESLDQIPSHRVLLAFLAGYCLLLSPLGRALAARRGRPLVTWLALPLIVLAFIGIANAKLSITRPRVPLLREIAVVQAPEGATTGLWRSFVSFYSPHQAVYRIDAPTPDMSLGYLVASDHRGLNRATLAYADGVPASELEPGTPAADAQRAATFRLDALPLAPRSTTTLEAAAPIAIGGGVELAHANGQWTITNGLPVDLDRGMLVTRRETLIDVPGIRAGASATADARAGSAGTDALTDGARDRKVIELVLGTIKKSRSRPLFIGWTRRAVGGIRPVAPGAAADELSHSALTFYVTHPRRVSE